MLMPVAIVIGVSEWLPWSRLLEDEGRGTLIYGSACLVSAGEIYGEAGDDEQDVIGTR